MFESAELGCTLNKAKFEEEASTLRTELPKMQRGLSGASSPVVILVGGAGTRGRHGID